MTSLKIAVEGCGHGMLDEIYDELAKACHLRDWTLKDLDFLIICGDFQAMRNEQDLNCMSCPKRYRALGDFHKYYSGEKKAPVLTIVIGGNHEASNYFTELHHGGWLAPNIYYLGEVNVIRYGPYRIAGMSGIYKSRTYQRPRNARLPYDRKEISNVYHVRERDVSKLLHVKEPVDICLSHDWPRRVEWHGDYEALFRAKPHFLESARIDSLGNAPAEQVMSFLRPLYWFSGHMHVRYSATVHHNEDADIFKYVSVREDFRAQLPRSMTRHANLVKKTAPKSVSAAITNKLTRFLALDKPGPGHKFLETLVINDCASKEQDIRELYMERTAEGKFSLYYDEEWLAIIRSTSNSTSESGLDAESTKVHTGTTRGSTEDMLWVRDNITAKTLLRIPHDFEMVAPAHGSLEFKNIGEQPQEYPNPQTEKFCKLLGIQNKFSVDQSFDDEHGFITFG
ncbi:lariat debranching enzyme, C-terminal domain-containing protein [Phaeosphaeria sp. MPI-PUGE-AT-0046c]|nr:lariat debranching enzyme, C-terminal domain-containing protein [Phaeosphaeria sp. MPI-PUGE-AT-0046c]